MPKFALNSVLPSFGEFRAHFLRFDLNQGVRLDGAQFDAVPADSQTAHARRPRVLMVGTHPPHQVGSRSIGEDLGARLTARGFHLRIVSRRRSRILRVVEMLITVLAAHNGYDVAIVDVYSGAAFRWAEWVTRTLRLLRKPFVLTLHGGDLPQFAKKNQRRVISLLSSAAAITAPSAYLAEAMRFASNNVQVVPNPLELRNYSFSERRNPKAKLVWLRAFHKVYNPSLALPVLEKILVTYPDAGLTMVGPDKDGTLKAVQAEAEKRGVRDRIRFVGGVPKSEVPRWLSSGDFFLNTTSVDNAPVSVLEAMATGLLVISTAVGGVPFLLEQGRDGILVPAGDSAAMADAVHDLLNDPEKAAMLSRNARAKAETYSWDVILPRWEFLLMQVAESTNA